jgi:apolipoprotein N-acyltransferase
VLTCYDGTYPFVARDLAASGARAILTPSMDPAEWGPLQHADHALFYPLRACEVRRPIVRAASSGTSLALDAYGRELARVDPFEPGTLSAVVGPRDDLTLWVRGGWLLPHVAIAVCAASLLVGLLTRREVAR